jgi:hypothetical protein
VSLLSLFILFLAILAGWIFFDQDFLRSSTSSNRESSPSNTFKQLDSVPVLEWNDSLDLKTIIRGSEPLIIRGNHPPSVWKALKKWTPDYILEHIDQLLNVKNSSDPVFLPAVARPYIIPLSSKNTLRDNFILQNLTTKQFLDGSENSSHYLYYFGPLEYWMNLASDLAPRSLLEFPLEGSNFTSSTSIFMSYKGVTAHTHYDCSSNLFLQVYGRKRWILYSPADWENLYLYPNLHLHYHQSQVDWAHPNSNLFPHFAQARPREAFLYPGDLLFVPAFWPHRVESVDFSISISTMNPSVPETIFGKFYWSPLPISQSWNLLKKVMAIKRIMFELARVMFEDDPRFSNLPTFVSEVLLKSRYFPMKDALLQFSTLQAKLEESECFKFVSKPSLEDIEANLEPFLKRKEVNNLSFG